MALPKPFNILYFLRTRVILQQSMKLPSLQMKHNKTKITTGSSIFLCFEYVEIFQMLNKQHN